MMLSACMVLSCINAPSYAMADEPTVRILENKGDMYTLENYVTSLKEAEQIQKKFFEEGIYEYSISFDSGVEWKVDVERKFYRFNRYLKADIIMNQCILE